MECCFDVEERLTLLLRQRRKLVMYLGGGIAGSNLRLGAVYSERFRQTIEASQCSTSTVLKPSHNLIIEYVLPFVVP
jgi:hypothetical protein